MTGWAARAAVRALAALSAAALLWSIVVALTGGVVARLGTLRLTSRDPVNALLVAAAAAVLAYALLRLAPGATALREEWAWWKGRAVGGAHRARRAVIFGIRHAAAVVLVAGALIDIYLWARSLTLWLDEEMIALNLRDRSFGELTGTLWLGQSAPLGWLIVQRAVLLTLGSSEQALRLVPVLFGIATLGIGWWIARRWMGWAGGVVLALMLVFGQHISHFRFEVKHYSADTLAGLLLPALAVWAAEAPQTRALIRRSAIWWGTAAVGQLFANGALLVTPACALWLFLQVVRRGRRAATAFFLCGLGWLAAFGAHYALSLRYTHHNRYLRSVWAGEVLPRGAGVGGAVRWIASRLAALADNPAGASWPTPLWVSAAGGFALGRFRSLGAVYALLPLTAFLLAIFRFVPLYGRFSLWIAPALYVGVALLVDRLVTLIRDVQGRGRHLMVATAAAGLVMALWVAADVIRRGSGDLLRVVPRNIHRIDDRAAVPWLLSHRQPGDALMTTRLGWPAIWWYGGIPVSDPAAIRRRGPDGSAMYEMVHQAQVKECSVEPLRAALQGHPRVLVHLGFPDTPEGFQNLLIDVLGDLGAITAFQQFTDLSLAAVVDLRQKDTGERELIKLTRRSSERNHPGGCIGARPARTW
jgi:hypothetical protein